MDGFNMDYEIPHNLYGFSLSGLTSRILWRLKPLDMCYQIWPNNIGQYLQILLHDQPKYILGMGTYTVIYEFKCWENQHTIPTLVRSAFHERTLEFRFNFKD